MGWQKKAMIGQNPPSPGLTLWRAPLLAGYVQPLFSPRTQSITIGWRGLLPHGAEEYFVNSSDIWNIWNPTILYILLL